MATRQDPEFFMTLVTFQVEDCLFRVPRHTLERQSKFFEDMLQYVGLDNSGHPIPLDGATPDEFRCLLRVLYPSVADTAHDAEDWLSVLKLARLWKCDTLCQRAAEQLPYGAVRKSAAEKVALALAHDIRAWLVPGVNELARRPEPLAAGDVELLGLDVVLKVAAVRESLVFAHTGPMETRRPPPVRVASGTRDAANVDFTKTIKKVFDLPDIYEDVTLRDDGPRFAMAATELVMDGISGGAPVPAPDRHLQFEFTFECSSSAVPSSAAIRGSHLSDSIFCE